MAIAYLGLGANLGNKCKQLITAMTLLARRVGDIPALSGFHETIPWGYQSVHPFLNVAVRMETSLSPFELLAATQQIEHELGRISTRQDGRYTDRAIDIDILMYDELILQTPDLILPHPLMHQRLFVLQPLAAIAPDLMIPVVNKTVAEQCQTLLAD
jgi:2-amino-4-hydroxy-6-hydroxymethyldihydropteridine diphosphokinase